MSAHADPRSTELARRLAAVERRIEAACAAAGRPREAVDLVVVTKYFPAQDVRRLHALGVRQVAESRHQEGVQKRAELTDLTDLVWHFVGGLQSNKAAAVGGWADVVQSVDRRKLLRGLGRAAQERGRPLEVCVQVRLDPDGAEAGVSGPRSGCAPGESLDLARAVAATEGLRLRGVMAVAPRAQDPAAAFARLAEVAAGVVAEVTDATWISAGMSADLEPAIAAGATHVRVGTAVLGNRPSTA